MSYVSWLPDVTHFVVLAHGHAGGVLALALLARHPLAGEVRRGERSGGVGRRVLALLRRELTVGTVLLTAVTGLEEGGRHIWSLRHSRKKTIVSHRHSDTNCCSFSMEGILLVTYPVFYPSMFFNAFLMSACRLLFLVAFLFFSNTGRISFPPRTVQNQKIANKANANGKT